MITSNIRGSGHEFAHPNDSQHFGGLHLKWRHCRMEIGMTVWAEKSFQFADWAPVQDLFERQFMSLRGPRDMMMISIKHDDYRMHTIIIAVPDKAHLALYPGFEPMPSDRLPKTASLLVGIQDSFEEKFQLASAA